jgi:iron complex outermembrane receptor protein
MADPTDSATIGEARNQGIEFDLTGQIARGLSLIGVYAFTYAHITKDNFGNEGHRLADVPEHSGRFWLRHMFPESSVLNGWTGGAGVYVASDRAGDNANTFVLPGFARMDAFAAYRFSLGKSRLRHKGETLASEVL